MTTRDTRRRTIQRWYYLDMKKCIAEDSDREDAILSVPEDRIIKTFRGEEILDISSPEKEYAKDMFPLYQIFDSSKWRRGYNKYWNHDSWKSDLWDNFEDQVVENFKQYQVPVIELDKETSKEAVCIVFEKVNTGGVTLTVFELLTASFAADNFQLREDWIAREERLKNAHPVLRRMESTLFLQALTLLATKAKGGAVSCRRRDILRLQTEEYKTWADRTEKGFIRAAQFLHDQKIFNAWDLPYQTQLIPLATILADLDNTADTEGARQKIARWYWCGVLGEIYGGASETLFARDLPEVVEWVQGDVSEAPSTIQDANFQASRLLTLRTRNSAAYKGIHALLMRDGSRDFCSGKSIEAQTFFNDNIDIHHIFPRSWCDGEDIDANIFNSIINKTAISASCNRSIGGRAPSVYLSFLERKADMSVTDMDEILTSHRILADRLRADDFNQFFADRAEGLIQSIEAVMGKNVTREEGLFWLGETTDDYDDGPKDWDENVD